MILEFDLAAGIVAPTCQPIVSQRTGLQTLTHHKQKSTPAWKSTSQHKQSLWRHRSAGLCHDLIWALTAWSLWCAVPKLSGLGGATSRSPAVEMLHQRLSLKIQSTGVPHPFYPWIFHKPAIGATPMEETMQKAQRCNRDATESVVPERPISRTTLRPKTEPETFRHLRMGSRK